MPVVSIFENADKTLHLKEKQPAQKKKAALLRQPFAMKKFH
jgi:hypothetical protein